MCVRTADAKLEGKQTPGRRGSGQICGANRQSVAACVMASTGVTWLWDSCGDEDGTQGIC